MNSVEPIRDLDVLDEICEYLKLKNERDYMMFMLGIHTGLRISDILKLRVRDLRNKPVILIKEQKTGHVKEIPLDRELKQALRPYLADKRPDEYVIASSQKSFKPITRVRAYQILREVGDVFNLESIGTHTMRKTFGYHFYYQNGKDVTLLMHIFGHSTQQVTLRYIGVSSNLCKDAMRSFGYKRRCYA